MIIDPSTPNAGDIIEAAPTKPNLRTPYVAPKDSRLMRLLIDFDGDNFVPIMLCIIGAAIVVCVFLAL